MAKCAVFADALLRGAPDREDRSYAAFFCCAIATKVRMIKVMPLSR